MKKIKNRTLFVILSMIMITLFTAAVFVFAAYDKTIPDSLIVAFFSAWTVELALLAGIQIRSNDDMEE